MRFLVVSLFLVLFNLKGNAQQEETPVDLASINDFTFFSDAIRENIRLYKVNSQVANEKNDLERAQFLYDSLVNHCLKNTHFDNFLVTKFNGDLMYFDSFEKPIYLKTTAKWCEPNASEIDALNDVAKEFSDLIDFVVLYWDPFFKLEGIDKLYNEHVTLIYVDEVKNYNSDIIDKVKHSLGLPSIFLMNKSRTLLQIKKGISPKFTPTASLGLAPFGEFNPEASTEHFVNSYNEYFNDITEDVNLIISNM